MSSRSLASVAATPADRAVEAARPGTRASRTTAFGDGSGRDWSRGVVSDPAATPMARHTFGQMQIYSRPARPLIVGKPDDAYEVEAEQAADSALARGAMEPDSSSSVPIRSEARSNFSSAKPALVQARAAPGSTPQVTPELPRQIESAASEGRPLSTEQRAFYGERLGHDFSAIRIHAGPAASAAAASVKAQAFTHGQEIYFGQNYYRPESAAGQKLMAHELAHTVQQRPDVIARRALDGADSGVAPDAAALANLTATPPPTMNSPDDPTVPSVGAGRPDPHADGKDKSATTDQATPQDGKSGPPRDAADGPAAAVRDQVKSAAKDGLDPKAETDTDSGAASGAHAKSADGLDSSSLAGLPTGDLALIDKELAEHQRWGQAGSMVGAAGSVDRAKFVADAAAKGSGFGHGLAQGAAMGAGIKIAEKLIAKGAVKLAANVAVRLGTQAAKFTPLPAVGAVIGGVLAAYELYHRDWKATGQTIGRFGKGASIYDKLANSIESISTVIDVATQVLNVIAGVIGAISIAMWVITVLTVGVATPLAATLSTIAVGIGLATLILDGINALVLKELVTVFRALHAFTSEADPRDVVTQGTAISNSAAAATGFVGGLAGGLAGGGLAEKGAKKFSAKTPTTPVPDHPTPGPASGDGPAVVAEAPKTPTDASPGPVQADAPVKPDAVMPVEATPSAKVAEPTVKAEATAPVEVEPPVKSEPATPMEAKPKDMTAGKKKPVSRKKMQEKLERLAKQEELSNADIQELADYLGKSPAEIRSMLIEADLHATIDQRAAMSEGGGRDPIFDKIPKRPSAQTPKEMARVKQLTGQGKMPPRVERSIRKQSKKNFVRENREAAADTSKHTPLTLESRENIAEHGLEYVEAFEGGTPTDYAETRGSDYVDPESVQREGMPLKFEESHFVPVKQEPAFAHKGASVAEIHEQHIGETHAANTAAELELLTRRGEPSPGFQTEVSPQKGVIVESKALLKKLETRRANAEKKANRAESQAKQHEGNGKVDQAQRARDRAREYREEANSLRIQEEKLCEGIPELDQMLASGSKEARKDLGPPSRAASQAAKSAAAAAPVPATPSQPPAVIAPQTLAPVQQASTPVVENTPPSLAPTLATAAPTTATNAPNPAASSVPELPAAAKPIAPPAPKTEAPKPAPSEPQPRPAKDPKTYLPPASHLGMHGGGADTSDTESTGDSPEAVHKGPTIEHVNPHYPPPPCTPQQIVDVQNEIHEAQNARAQSQATSAAMGKEAARHKANEKPLGAMGDRTKDAIDAAGAHQGSVDKGAKANEKQDEREDKASGALSNYTDRAAKLATITVPMRGFARFTSLATSLPDSPDVLVGAKRGLLKMNADSQRFLDQLDAMERTINAQKAGQSERKKQIATDAKTFSQTDAKAKASAQSLATAQQKTQDLTEENKARVDEATKLRNEADQSAGTLGAQAQAKQAEAASLSTALQNWARTHRQARLDALDATAKTLEQQGYKVTEVRE